MQGTLHKQVEHFSVCISLSAERGKFEFVVTQRKKVTNDWNFKCKRSSRN